MASRITRTSRQSVVLSAVAIGCLAVSASGSNQPEIDYPSDPAFQVHSLCTPTGPPPNGGYIPYLDGIRGRDIKVIDGVPDYLWHHGCGPTAAGMVVGYWDTHGYPDLIPGDASQQTYQVNQAIASQGVNSHYNDYSLPIDSPPDPPIPDLSEPPADDEHASNCIADFMRTSWSAANMHHGSSWFHDVHQALENYTAWANDTYGSDYIVDGWPVPWANFSWPAYKDEINADRPMVLLVDTDGDGGTDHFVTAIGWRFESGYAEYACLDTWGKGFRWERFRRISNQYAWGIYGVVYFVPEPLNECPADLNDDEQVDIDDLFAVLAAWGPCDDPEDCPQDVNQDGVVDIDDLFEVLANWGPCS